MKNNIKDIVISAVALTIIGGVVTAALAGTNALTSDTIAKQVEQTETAARREVMDADSFEMKITLDGEEQVTYYQGVKNGSVVGYVFTVSSTGKSSGLIVMTGITADGKVSGVKITGDNETAGYVKKVTEGGLLKAFTEKQAQQFKLGDQIDGVSQATKTSKGVTDGVNKAVSYYNLIKEEAGK